MNSDGHSLTPARAAARHAPLVAALTACLIATAQPAAADLAAPNAAGIAMGHVHYHVADVDANTAFWVALGGTATDFPGGKIVRFPGLMILIADGESDGGTEGSVVNHIAFRVESLANLESEGFEMHYNEAYPGIASVYTPEGERIELFDDAIATNIGFDVAPGIEDAAAERHNRPLTAPIVTHHAHFYVPEDQVSAARDWYVAHFGATPGRRWRYEAADVPGMNLNFSAADERQAPTEGRMLDHIGFEVRNLEAFCRALEARGVALDEPYRKLPSGFGLAFLTDPWGTRIELTEGLEAF
jgi:catechol 2,3-dioxygenase-like lactoylglutathione lyase family enzyme